MINGSYVALITPFNEDGSVNFKKIEELCEWHIENGTDGIVALGTTGESSTMEHEEDDAVVRCVLKTVNGRIPVIAGSGSNCTETMLMKSKTYCDLGADGLLVITPYYNKTNTQGMIRHFTTVADQVDLPLVLYNVPGRTGINLPVECVKVLSQHKNIVAIKEASGNLSYVTQIARYVNEEFKLFSGNDDIIIPIMALGGSGVISVFANICPKQTRDMVHAYLDGDTKRALRMQLQYLDLINALFIEVNPIPVKEAMNMLGMDVGGYRLPLYEMEEKNRAVLRQELRILTEAEAQRA